MPAEEELNLLLDGVWKRKNRERSMMLGVVEKKEQRGERSASGGHWRACVHKKPRTGHEPPAAASHAVLSSTPTSSTTTTIENVCRVG